MPSVMEAAMNSAVATISFSPLPLVNRLEERIQISSGMLKMRLSVMELGRFTGRNNRHARGRNHCWPDYPPLRAGKAMEENRAGGLTGGEAETGRFPQCSLRNIVYIQGYDS